MKKVLFSVSYLLDVEENLLLGTDESESFSDIVFQKLAKNRRKKIDETHFAQWNKSSFIVLDPQTMNCGKCAECGEWTTDMEKVGSIDGLTNGAMVDDLLYCDDCLPKGHKWAF